MPVPPRYSQVFVYDPGAACNYRMAVEANQQCDRNIMTTIDQVMREVNPYVHQYQHLHQVMQEEERRAGGAAA